MFGFFGGPAAAPANQDAQAQQLILNAVQDRLPVIVRTPQDLQAVQRMDRIQGFYNFFLNDPRGRQILADAKANSAEKISSPQFGN